MWILIATVLWYHAPAVTQVPGFTNQTACETAAVAFNKKFTSDEWVNGAVQKGQSICVRAY